MANAAAAAAARAAEADVVDVFADGAAHAAEEEDEEGLSDAVQEVTPPSMLSAQTMQRRPTDPLPSSAAVTAQEQEGTPDAEDPAARPASAPGTPASRRTVPTPSVPTLLRPAAIESAEPAAPRVPSVGSCDPNATVDADADAAGDEDASQEQPDEDVDAAEVDGDASQEELEAEPEEEQPEVDGEGDANAPAPSARWSPVGAFGRAAFARQKRVRRHPYRCWPLAPTMLDITRLAILMKLCCLTGMVGLW